MASSVAVKIDVKLTKVGRCRLWLAVKMLATAAKLAGNSVAFDIAMSRAKNGPT